jgi:hypothetical protein
VLVSASDWLAEELSDLVWEVLATGAESHTLGVFESVSAARRLAESAVGNRSYAAPGGRGKMFLYGPGDGSTTVMVRALPKEPPAAKPRALCT